MLPREHDPDVTSLPGPLRTTRDRNATVGTGTYVAPARGTMKQIAWSLLSLAAIAASSLVLLADSTDDCGVYLGFDQKYAYTTDCFGGDTGSMRIKVAEHTVELQDSVASIETEQGKLSFFPGRLKYVGSCSGGEGKAHLVGLGVDIGSSADAGASTRLHCSGWADGSEKPVLNCYEDSAIPGPDAASTCTLSLTLTK